MGPVEIHVGWGGVLERAWLQLKSAADSLDNSGPVDVRVYLATCVGNLPRRMSPLQCKYCHS